MQKILFVLSVLCMICFLLLKTSCTADQLEAPPQLMLCDTLQVSYDLQVKTIIDSNCAFSGCHVAGSAAPGNYASYSSMKPFLNDREFKRYVVDLRNDPNLGMPPNWNTNPGPKDLSEEEFNILTCWIENDYPE